MPNSKYINILSIFVIYIFFNINLNYAQRQIETEHTKFLKKTLHDLLYSDENVNSLPLNVTFDCMTQLQELIIGLNKKEMWALSSMKLLRIIFFKNSI